MDEKTIPDEKHSILYLNPQMRHSLTNYVIYINNVDSGSTMESINMKSAVPLIIGLSLLVLFSFAFNDVNAQLNTTGNTTTGNFTETPTTTIPATAPTVNATANNSTADTLNAVNQTSSSSMPQELNQTAVQNTPQSNQTNPNNSSKLSGSQLNEKLLNYTNNAILALNDDNETEIEQNLVQIQDDLIKAIGKPVVIIPAPALESSSDSG